MLWIAADAPLPELLLPQRLGLCVQPRLTLPLAAETWESSRSASGCHQSEARLLLYLLSDRSIIFGKRSRMQCTPCCTIAQRLECIQLESPVSSSVQLQSTWPCWQCNCRPRDTMTIAVNAALRLQRSVSQHSSSLPIPRPHTCGTVLQPKHHSGCRSRDVLAQSLLTAPFPNVSADVLTQPFAAANVLISIPWALLIIAPRWVG